MINFEKWFESKTGNSPYNFQIEFATNTELPGLVKIPTGCGKTAMILLGWLWRRVVTNDPTIRQNTPRRLIYCLPMRVLVEQTFEQAKSLCEKLDGNKVNVYKVMGGENDNDYILQPEKDSIIIGTQDMLLSRALNRGYATSRYRWPMDFGLLNNDSLWVLDEVQLMGVGLATTAQLAAFRHQFETFGKCHTVWMSATLEKEWLKTVDHKCRVETIHQLELSSPDREQIINTLTAPKHLERYPETLKKSDDKFTKNLAEFIYDHHQENSQTLVIVNTVDRAQELYKKIKDQLGIKKGEQSEQLMLIHSRFRPKEREALNNKLHDNTQSGRIIVATQVVEAGVDITSKFMITELAPWSSLVQRFGRCNRKGQDGKAKICWIDFDDLDKNCLPYEEEELKQAREYLTQFEGKSVSPQAIEDEKLCTGEYQPRHVIRRKDIVELFDTTPDLTGTDIDISRFVRDEDDNREVQVFWREWEQPKGYESPPVEKSWRKVNRNELCSVPISKFYDFAKTHDNKIWRWDLLDGKWVRVDKNNIYPGLICLIHSIAGGYHNELGWLGKDEKTEVEPVQDSNRDKAPDNDDTFEGDDYSQLNHWKTIAQHTDDVVEQLSNIIELLNIEDDLIDRLQRAARWHDLGKAHPAFQAKLNSGMIDQANFNGNPIAKAPRHAWVKGENSNLDVRKYFRHELASALGMLQLNLPDLSVYLAAAHHGKVRLSIRSMPEEKRPPDPSTLFARGVWDGDELPETDLGCGEISPSLKLSLECMQLGRSDDGQPSWLERMLNLRDEYGIFRLAYLEAIFRAADQRASQEENQNA